MSLQEYRSKRDFKKTREPKAVLGRSKSGHLFVVQKHAASHLHYDFRLEVDGVLKSWAVPKGPSLDPADKRLAVQVEDHPMSYAHFEGEIPEDEYGGGHVIVWDTGEWKTEGNPATQLKKGRLEFELRGEKLKGRWLLIRTRSSGKKPNWLLIKRHDKEAREDDILLETESVLSGHRLAGDTKAPRKSRARPSLKKSAMPAKFEPELAFLVDSTPAGPQWIHEIKYDGYRTLARKEKNSLQLITRGGLDWTTKYPEIAAECKKLKAKDFVLDGEIAWVDENGRTRFDGLQNALSEGKTENLIYYVFDLLFLNGHDIREAPLVERKKVLEALIEKSRSHRILFSSHWEQSGDEVLKSACDSHLEGIISKNKNAPYESGRSKNWLKSKCKNNQEFVIGGYTLQENKSLAALLVGGHNSRNELQYTGRVGTGFNAKSSQELLKKFHRLHQSSSPFGENSPSGRGVFWIKPKLVANIEFGAWTDDQILRHAAFKGLREDKKAQEVQMHEMRATEMPVVSHPEKILFSKEKLTKQDLAHYYQEIQNWILPYVAHRPLSLLRCPNGEGKTCFFQKHVEAAGHGLHQTQIQAPLHEKKESVLWIDSAEGLVQLVQMGNLEIHARGGLYKNPDYADLMVFDLDPDPGVSFSKVKKAALTLRDLLLQLDLKSFIKASGGKGLHLHVPLIENTYTWDEIKNFSRTVSEQMVTLHPKDFTVNILKAKRKGKIFLDYLRNGYGATAIATYSARAKPNASVAFPLSWKEIEKLKSADQFTVKNVPAILKKRKDPWADYFKTKQRILVLDQASKIKT